MQLTYKISDKNKFIEKRSPVVILDDRFHVFERIMTNNNQLRIKFCTSFNQIQWMFKLFPCKNLVWIFYVWIYLVLMGFQNNYKWITNANISVFFHWACVCVYARSYFTWTSTQHGMLNMHSKLLALIRCDLRHEMVKYKNTRRIGDKKKNIYSDKNWTTGH